MSADSTESQIPRIYSLSEAADLLGVTHKWLRGQISKRRFGALKRAGKWAMTEPQILDAIETMIVPARAPEPNPTGLTPRSSRMRQSTTRTPPDEGVAFRATPVHAEPPEVIAAMPRLSPTQLALLAQLREDQEVVISGKTARRTVESLVRRGLVTYQAEYLVNENGGHYRFTVHLTEQ